LKTKETYNRLLLSQINGSWTSCPEFIGLIGLRKVILAPTGQRGVFAVRLDTASRETGVAGLFREEAGNSLPQADDRDTNEFGFSPPLPLLLLESSAAPIFSI
jgi:hypothetical protein